MSRDVELKLLRAEVEDLKISIQHLQKALENLMFVAKKLSERVAEFEVKLEELEEFE